jgi:hypothetical protein
MQNEKMRGGNSGRFQNSFEQAWGKRITHQHLGLRRPRSGAFTGKAGDAKAAEGCRSPRPHGIFRPHIPLVYPYYPTLFAVEAEICRYYPTNFASIAVPNSYYPTFIAYIWLKCRYCPTFFAGIAVIC